MTGLVPAIHTGRILSACRTRGHVDDRTSPVMTQRPVPPAHERLILAPAAARPWFARTLPGFSQYVWDVKIPSISAACATGGRKEHHPWRASSPRSPARDDSASGTRRALFLSLCALRSKGSRTEFDLQAPRDLLGQRRRVGERSAQIQIFERAKASERRNVGD